MSLNRTTPILVVLLALAAVAPTAQAGPFPAADPLNELADVMVRESGESLEHGTATSRALFEAGAAAVNAAQRLEFPLTPLEAAFGAIEENGVGLVQNAGEVGTTAVHRSGDMADVSVTYGAYLGELGQRRAGVSVTEGSTPPVTALESRCFPAEVLDVIVDFAAPGSEFPICAGTYEGDLVIDTEFVTLRGVQGPFATLIRGTVQVEATGVAITGVTIEDGGVVVGGAGDGYLGEIWGTLLYRNIFSGNGAGVQIGHAEATFLIANTFRGNGAGVVVQGVDGTLDGTPSVGVVLAANNFVRNGAYAVRIDGLAGVPVLSLGDHYGGSPPSVAVVDGLCVGAGATDTRCRNAVSLGVVVAAPAPIAYPTL